MLFFKTVEEFKSQLEHDIEWNKEQIKSIKEWARGTRDARDGGRVLTRD